MRAVYDCFRFVAGGVIGAVIALYFTRMIPPLNAEAFALSMGFFLLLYGGSLFVCHWFMDQKEAELREKQRFLDSLSDEIIEEDC
jgi:ABC-type uncharacterized transport system permease subunit